MQPEPIEGREQAERAPCLLRFGPFEADLRKRELRKGNAPLRIPPQAFQILEILASREGQIVSRQELISQLWSDGTHVNFERSLTVMVNRLRSLLGDSVSVNRYIETTPKAGYRFVRSVERIYATEEYALTVHGASEQVPFAVAPRGDAPAPGRLPLTTARLSVAAVLAVVTLATLAWLFLRSRTQGDSPRTTIPINTLAGKKDFAALSPDGSQVALVWTGPDTQDPAAGTQKDLFVQVVGAGEPLRLTQTREDEMLPAWSPDGSHLAFIRSVDNRYWVYIVPALGGLERFICESGLGVSWSPSGKELVISGAAEANRNSLLIVTLETGQRRRITWPGSASDSLPQWSPDGRRIAFLRSITLSQREVMVMPAAGGAPVQLTHHERPIWGLTWTPDSRSIIYSVNVGSGETLWRIAANGGTPVREPETPNNVRYPNVARRAPRLAYTQEYSNNNLYLYDGASYEKRTAFSPSSRDEDSPAFSPDGRTIAFSSRRTGSEEIWVAPADSGIATQLTYSGGTAAGSPAWSPDGEWIAFDSRISGRSEVYIIRRDGSGMHRLSSGGTSNVMPKWSPDGNWIYYTSTRDGESQIWRMPARGGASSQVTTGGAFECAPSPDGKHLYFTRRMWHSGIWSVPAGGGAEVAIRGLENAGANRSWCVNARGLYYARGDNARHKTAIVLFHPDSSKSELVLTVDGDPLRLQSGLAFNAGSSALMLARLDNSVYDLLLTEPVR